MIFGAIILLASAEVALTDRAATVEVEVHSASTWDEAYGDESQVSDSRNDTIKELNYGSMHSMARNLGETVEDFNREVAGELTSKASSAVKAGQEYASRLKEQDAGHLGYATGVKTFRTAVAGQHHQHTQDVRTALGSATAGGSSGNLEAEQLLTATEADSLQHAHEVQGNDAEQLAERIEGTVQHTEHGFSDKAFHLMLRWQKDVDLNLHLNAPPHGDMDVAFNNSAGADGFVVGAKSSGLMGKQDGWHVEDITTENGHELPKGRYRAWASYVSGVPGAALPTGPEHEDLVKVPFEAELTLGGEKKVVSDSLMWEMGHEYDKVNQSMLVFDFTLGDDNKIEW